MLVEFGGWVLSRGMTGPDLHLGRLAVLLGQKQTAGARAETGVPGRGATITWMASDGAWAQLLVEV